jgi:uncharacterized protein (TIGR02466 family)
MSVSNPPWSSSSQQISLAFPTLIGKFQIADTDGVNDSLERIILDREKSTPSRDYANHGGWHSAGDLLDWPGQEIAMLKSWISEGLNQMVRATLQLPEVQSRNEQPKGGFRVSAWANVARKGNYHRMHNHPTCAWSGCYYIRSTSQIGSLAGVLEFSDPRPFTEMVETPGHPYGQRIIVRPNPGLLILFPSWLYHFVHPSDSESPRISVAFNAAWQSV